MNESVTVTIEAGKNGWIVRHGGLPTVYTTWDDARAKLEEILTIEK